MSQFYKYQLILFGSLESYSDRIKTIFLDTVHDLKMSKDSFEILTEENFTSQYKKNQPSFILYFGDEKGVNRNIEETIALLNDGNPVLPIYRHSFNIEIPKFLENQNGLKYKTSAVNKIVNIALESFGKLRNTRKVFISYKRSESTSVAIQLYEALERSNFDVFLDTHSIKQGEPFQDELWHRMSDSDVIVLLNTPRFLDSYWCKEEIAEANAKKIGVIQLIWPNNSLGVTNEICFPFKLSEVDFVNKAYINHKNAHLENHILDKIIQSVESIRARNLASRQDSLINEFLKISRSQGKQMCLQPERFITQILENKKRRLFVPCVGIPQSLDCHQSEEIRAEIKEYDIERLHLIYDDLRIREKWLKHLEWLNGYLEITTIRKLEFAEWLRKN